MDINSICLNCFGYRGEYDVCPHCGYVAGTMVGDAYLLPPGTVLAGRYLVGTVLGVGGFGATYRAWDATLGVPVAVKEFYPAGLVSRMPGDVNVRLFSGEKQHTFAQHLARFLDEARNLALFSGAGHVVNVFDYFEANGTAYIIMEYLDGQTLKEYIAARGGKLPADEALAIATGLLEGLSTIHQKNIIHRDISPDNIFMLRDGSVKVLDFGAARLGEEKDSELTQAVVIKMGYAPPEQYRSNMKQGVWTDIYAAGATLYKMLTGVTPEESVDRMEKDTLRKPNQMGAAVPAATDKAVMKAMALKPELRFQSADAMLAALQSRARVDYPEEELKKRKRLRTLIVSLAAVVLVALGGMIAWQATRPQKETLADVAIEPDTITVAVPVWDEARRAAYEEVARAFTEQYPEHNVTLQVTGYEAFTDGAASNFGKSGGPTVMQSAWVGTLDNAADLSLLADSLDRRSNWFLSEWEALYPGLEKIPTGLDVQVAYLDEVAFADAGLQVPDSLDSVAQLVEMGEGGCAVSLDATSGGYLLGTLHPDLYKDGAFGYGDAIGADMQAMAGAYASGAFTAADTGDVYVGWSGALRTIQGRWPGHYRILPVQGKNGMSGRLAGEWSVSAAATQNQQYVGMLFIHFLFSEYAQNTLYVQQDEYVPLNRTVFDQYMATNSEFTFLSSGAMGRMRVYGEDTWVLQDYATGLYGTVMDPAGPQKDPADYAGALAGASGED